MIWRGTGRRSAEEDETLRSSHLLTFSPSALSVGLVLSALLALLLLVSISLETRRQSREQFGVITAAEVVARQGDGPNYPPSFTSALHAGTEFDLIEQRPGWLHIRLSDGADAWVPEDTAQLQ